MDIFGDPDNDDFAAAAHGIYQSTELHNHSADDIICDPVKRRLFIAKMQDLLEFRAANDSTADEFEYTCNKKLMALRKAGLIKVTN